MFKKSENLYEIKRKFFFPKKELINPYKNHVPVFLERAKDPKLTVLQFNPIYKEKVEEALSLLTFLEKKSEDLTPLNVSDRFLDILSHLPQSGNEELKDVAEKLKYFFLKTVSMNQTISHQKDIAQFLEKVILGFTDRYDQHFNFLSPGGGRHLNLKSIELKGIGKTPMSYRLDYMNSWGGLHPREALENYINGEVIYASTPMNSSRSLFFILNSENRAVSARSINIPRISQLGGGIKNSWTYNLLSEYQKELNSGLLNLFACNFASFKFQGFSYEFPALDNVAIDGSIIDQEGVITSEDTSLMNQFLYLDIESEPKSLSSLIPETQEMNITTISLESAIRTLESLPAGQEMMCDVTGLCRLGKTFEKILQTQGLLHAREFNKFEDLFTTYLKDLFSLSYEGAESENVANYFKDLFGLVDLESDSYFFSLSQFLEVFNRYQKIFESELKLITHRKLEGGYILKFIPLIKKRFTKVGRHYNFKQRRVEVRYHSAFLNKVIAHKISNEKESSYEDFQAIYNSILEKNLSPWPYRFVNNKLIKQATHQKDVLNEVEEELSAIGSDLKISLLGKYEESDKLTEYNESGSSSQYFQVLFAKVKKNDNFQKDFVLPVKNVVLTPREKSS